MGSLIASRFIKFKTLRFDPEDLVYYGLEDWPQGPTHPQRIRLYFKSGVVLSCGGSVALDLEELDTILNNWWRMDDDD